MKVFAGSDEEEGGPDERGGCGLKHAQLLAVPDKDGSERGEGAGDQGGGAPAEPGYKTKYPPDQKNTDQDAEDAEGGVAFGGAEPAEKCLPVVECEIVGGRMFVSDQLEGARPNVGGAEPCPVERDGFVEPDAVVFKAPEAGQGGQDEDEELG